MILPPIQQALISVRAGETRWRGSLLAATPEVSRIDLDELRCWFSEDKTESVFHFESGNLFFHPLPSGHFAIGRMIPRSDGLFSLLHSARSFFVQHYIVSPESLLMFANNPIALYRQIQQVDRMPFFLNPPKSLKPVQLPEFKQPRPVVDPMLLGQLVQQMGPKGLSLLLQTALDSVCTFFTGGPAAIQVIEGLFNLLPLSWRTELTFSTELHFSRTKPLKIVGVSGGERLMRLNRSDLGISYCDLSEFQHQRFQSGTLLDSWPLLVFHALNRSDFAFLEEKFQAEWRKEQQSMFDGMTSTNPGQLRELAVGSFAELFARSLQKVERPVQGPIRQSVRTSAQETNHPVDPLSVQSPNHPTVFSFPFLEQAGPEREESVQDESLLEWTDSLSSDDAERFLSQVFAEENTLFAPYEETSGVPFFPAQDEFIPLTTLLETKVIPLTETAVSGQDQRLKRFARFKNELKWLDSCAARSLFGDDTALESFQRCWKTICENLDPLQQIELTEDYVVLIRDFLSQRNDREEHPLLDRDLNALELLDVLL
ncbi:MAG: hypothetical protein ACRC10_07515 [Thermoguttaceae bacterium]